MKKLSIYIDYAGENGRKLASKIKNRLKNIDGIDNIEIYSDIMPEDSPNADWETPTIKAIDSADIIIPILSEKYLSYVSDGIKTRFDKVINSKYRFLFPINHEASEWGSFNWVVRSKIIPSDNRALLSCSDNEIEEIINGLIKDIKNIILKVASTKKSKNTIKIKEISSANNVIFISHDHDDADFAELLKLKLEKENLTAWIDTERLKIGQDWREEIDQGIENSIAVIAIMTPDARKSEYVTYEWAFAWGKEKKIFPIMLKQTQLHPRLESLQYLDFTNRISRPWDELIKSIKELLA